MTWQTVASLASVVATVVLGGLAYKRSKRADDVLDVAANVKTTFEAQAEINEDLRADVVRLRTAHNQCAEETNSLRRSLADSYMKTDEQAREIAHLKATVDEHEHTITRHELTINQLRANRGD